MSGQIFSRFEVESHLSQATIYIEQGHLKSAEAEIDAADEALKKPISKKECINSSLLSGFKNQIEELRDRVSAINLSKTSAQSGLLSRMFSGVSSPLSLFEFSAYEEETAVAAEPAPAKNLDALKADLPATPAAATAAPTDPREVPQAQYHGMPHAETYKEIHSTAAPDRAALRAAGYGSLACPKDYSNIRPTKPQAPAPAAAPAPSPEEEFGSFNDEFAEYPYDHAFSAEFNLVKDDRPARNRYRNILAHEPTRVKIEGEGKFYFNANVIFPGIIASQGPLDHEQDQFWHMMFQKDIPMIVMVTDLIDSGRVKCSNYFADGQYGDYSVERTSQEAFPLSNPDHKLVKTTLQISRDGTSKEVTHFHLQGWNDYGVISPEDLATSVRIISAHNQGRGFLAHCSAGIGRTGTFLAAYQAKQTNEIEIRQSAREMRLAREGMIQTPEQYNLAQEAAQILNS